MLRSLPPKQTLAVQSSGMGKWAICWPSLSNTVTPSPVIYELGVQEIMVVAHSHCGACHMSYDHFHHEMQGREAETEGVGFPLFSRDVLLLLTAKANNFAKLFLSLHSLEQ